MTTGEEALGAAAAETVLMVLAAANHAIKIQAWGVFFDGVSPTAEPVLVKLVRHSSAGTFTDTVTIAAWDDNTAETFDTTAKETCTAEPTKTPVLECKNVHPQTGYEAFYPIGQEIHVKAAGQIGIEVTAPAAVNCTAYIRFEE
jgi:hypothetical protein